MFKKIIVVHKPSKADLESKGVFNWSIWSHPEAKIPWRSEDEEVCYFLEGKVTVTPENGKPIQIVKGDLVTLPKGTKCDWEISEPVKTHYRLD
jgi:uncharacterized cupin superfamily protein